MKKFINNYYFYTSINLLDKFLLFLLPFIILKFFNDNLTYNNIEYIYSISTIIAVGLDLGIKNYLLYSLKKSKKYSKDLNKISKIFETYFLLFVILLIVPLVILNLNFEKIYLINFILLRSTYMMLFNFYKIYHRASDKPSVIFLFSTLNSILTLSLIIFFNKNSIGLLNIFFLSQFLFILIYLFSIIVIQKNDLKIFKDLKIYIKKAFEFSWPLILSVIIFNFTMNFGKIYTFNFLGENEMTSLSFTQRILLIVILSHSIFSSYFQKKIYQSKDIIIDKNLIIKYLVLLTSILLIILFSYNELINFFNINVQNSVILYFLSLHAFLWCFSSYLDIYLTKLNKNISILIYQILCLSVFLIFIYYSNLSFLISFSIALNLYSCIYLILVVSKLKRMNCKIK